MGTIKLNQEIAVEVLEGKWGNGSERRERLTMAGYNYDDVQSIVNAMVHRGEVPYNFGQTDNQEAIEELVAPKGRFLEVHVDLSEYDGLQLIF